MNKKPSDNGTLANSRASNRANITEQKLLCECARIASSKMLAGAGGPFGALIVKSSAKDATKDTDKGGKANKAGAIISSGWNMVTSSNDPTAHAEVMAIRKACKKLGTFSLSGYELFSSAEPCPMCLMAAYWARVDRVCYLADRKCAARGGFDDEFLYDELAKSPDKRSLRVVHLDVPGLDPAGPFNDWLAKKDRVSY